MAQAGLRCGALPAQVPRYAQKIIRAMMLLWAPRKYCAVKRFHMLATKTAGLPPVLIEYIASELVRADPALDQAVVEAVITKCAPPLVRGFCTEKPIKVYYSIL